MSNRKLSFPQLWSHKYQDKHFFLRIYEFIRISEAEVHVCMCVYFWYAVVREEGADC